MTNMLRPPDVSIPLERRAAIRERLVRELTTHGTRAVVPRRVVIVLATLGLLAAAGTAVGLSTDFLAEQERADRALWAPPELKYLPSGSRVEIARGPDWSVMAWKSAGGICFAIAAGDATKWARGCGPMPDRNDKDPYTSDYLSSMLTYFERAADGRAAMVGAVTEEVFSVEITLDDGRTLRVPTKPAPEVVSPTARIFLIRERFSIPARGSWAYRSFVFRDARGRALERFTPERGAAGSVR
jgi:hypothetical protein